MSDKPRGGAMRGTEHDQRASALGDRALVVALRCGEPHAVREFVIRFRPMLVLAARRLGVDEGERDERVDDVLADALLHLAAPAAVVPLSVRGYLLRSLRNGAINAARARERRERAGVAAADAGGEGDPQFEQAVVGCVSEHTVQASHGPGWDGPVPVSGALAHLARVLIAEMGPEEHLLTTWLSHYVPQQEIAAWLGLSYEATSKRVRRLRARLQAAAARHTEHLSPREREEVLAFLRRSGEAGGTARGRGTHGRGAYCGGPSRRGESDGDRTTANTSGTAVPVDDQEGSR